MVSRNLVYGIIREKQEEGEKQNNYEEEKHDGKKKKQEEEETMQQATWVKYTFQVKHQVTVPVDGTVHVGFRMRLICFALS